MDTFSITNGTRGSLPRVPFLAIKDAILGKRYTFSLVFIGDTRMRALNRASRGKDATTDILSFPISESAGEVFISLRESAKRSRRFGLKPIPYLTFLFIHGCLHLKGYDHSDAMDRLEDSWSRKFGVTLPER